MSSDQAKVFTGLGGGSIKLQAKQDSDTTPSAEGAAAEGASAEGHLSDSDDGFGEGTVAPIALAVGAAAPRDKAAEKKSLSEDQMQQEGEDALRCFAEMKDQSDEVIHEREMGDLIKDCAKMASSCRKRSLAHMAKKLSDLNSRLSGAKPVLMKSKAYRRKPCEGLSKPLVAAVELAKKKHE